MIGREVLVKVRKGRAVLVLARKGREVLVKGSCSLRKGSEALVNVS